jgi:hypothetical protein
MNDSFFNDLFSAEAQPSALYMQPKLTQHSAASRGSTQDNAFLQERNGN